MQFTRFGVTLERLNRAHLEMVRQWRNSPWVRPYMRVQRLINPQEQVRWFEELDLDRNWYFVAHVENAPIALFHIKEIDWKLLCGESGGFVGSACFLKRPEAAQATLALMDFGFLLLELRSLEAQYHSDLLRVMRFNESLGYRIFRSEADGFVRARVTSLEYLECAAIVRRAAATLHGPAAVLNDTEDSLAPMIARRTTSYPDFQLQVALSRKSR